MGISEPPTSELTLTAVLLASVDAVCHLPPPPAPPGGVFRSFTIESCRSLQPDHDELAATHPVEAVVKHADSESHHTIRCRYLMGCDGARSIVRRWVAGGEVGDGEWKGKITMQGEATDIVWGEL